MDEGRKCEPGSTRRRSPRARELGADERGAIMVVGAFMSIFLVGVLYSIAGIGETIVYQERLQDTADSAAYAAAVTHARSMNTIATVNASMVVLQAALAGFRLPMIAARLCVEFYIIRVPGACESLLELHTGHFNAAYRRLLRELQEGSRAAESVALATPGIARDEVERIISERAGSSTSAGFLVEKPMAVSRNGNSSICALANLHAFRLAQVGMGIDVLRLLAGEGEARVARDLPQCIPEPGVNAQVPSIPERPVGTEPFQVRVMVVGDTRRLRGYTAAVRMPRQVIGNGEGGGSRSWVDPNAADTPATLVTAQAEYYSRWENANLLEDTVLNSVEEDCFRSDWRARLRRFRIPTGGATDRAGATAAYESWREGRLGPSCGGRCNDVSDAISAANGALH